MTCAVHGDAQVGIFADLVATTAASVCTEHLLGSSRQRRCRMFLFLPIISATLTSRGRLSRCLPNGHIQGSARTLPVIARDSVSLGISQRYHVKVLAR